MEGTPNSSIPPAPPTPPTPPINKMAGFSGMPKFDDGPKKEQFNKAPAIKTFKSDVAETVQTNHISVVQMALAESRKRAQSDELIEAASPTSSRNLGWIIGSIVLIVVAIGAVGYFYWKSTLPVPTVVATPIQTDIIYSEQKKVLDVKDLNKKNLVALINSQRDTQLPLGSILKVQIGASEQITATKFFDALYPRMPDVLTRSLDDKFFLGLHAFSSNEPLLVLTINNYDTAYAGMLAWEKDMRDDIGALFVKPELLLAPTPTASSTASSTTVSAPTLSFQDKVIENKDTRVLMNTDGKTLFFYSFVDKKTLVFTTNQNTLKEILIRIDKPKLIH